MAEREKYEQWLRELEAKRDSTPEKVFARVHADYSSRLATVAEQLRSHTKSMQERAGNLMAKLRELEASAKKIEDELAESEIRKEVGELSTSEFDSMAKKAQRELTRFEDDQERIADDLNRIREILGGTPIDKDEDEPRTSQDFDELKFLQSVVGAGTPVSSPKVDSSRPRATPTQAATPIKTPTPSRPTPTQEPPAPRPSPVSFTPAVPAPPVEEKKEVEAPTEGPLAIRPSGGMEQPKTLKCAECGSMNYSSEWYCERCGAELAQI